MTIRLAAALALVGFSAPILSGCGSSPPPPPVLELAVTGSADQNPSPDHTAQPVAVHLYQLAATQKFTNADVYAVIEHEQATLGADDLGSTSFVLKPSEKQEIKQEMKSGTKAIGVVVWFHDIDTAQWRASAPVAASGTSKLVLNVEKLSVSLKPAGK